MTVDESDYEGDFFPFALTAPAPAAAHAPLEAASAVLVPYKHVVLPDQGKLLTFTRSICGKTRQIVQRVVKSWSYIKLPDGDVHPSRTISLLKEELSTDGVTYDETYNAYRVEPSESVTRRVREIAQQITPAAFTTYSILSSLGRRFFSQIDPKGEWLDMASDDETAMAELTDAARGAIRTGVWTTVNSRIVAFVESPVRDDAAPTVHVWTTHRSLSQNKNVAASAAASITRGAPTRTRAHRESEDTDDDCGFLQIALDIRVRHFNTQEELVDEIAHSMEKLHDITVHYGDAGADAGAQDPVAEALSRVRALTGARASADIFDLKDYIENVYTDMPSYTFRSVVSEIAVAASSEDEDSGAQYPCTSSDAIAMGAMNIFATGDEERQEVFITRFSSGDLPHTEENLVYLLRNVASRAFLMGRLYAVLSKAIFDLMYLSGCNMSALTQREHTSRGVVSFIDAMAAYSQIVDTLPHDYMDPGVHSRTFVTPFSSILISAMMESDDQTTAVIGNMVQPLRGYGWLVREIFSLRSLKPLPPPDIPSAFGIFRGMVYSTEPIEGHASDRQWSSILYVGLGSWIGITLDASNADEDGAVPPDSAGISFGYFGIEEVCRHPFDAVRIAVETYLSLRIRSNSNASPRTVVASMVTGKVLNDENMAIRRCITAANLHEYEAIVPEHERRLIASGEKSIVMNMWYREDGKSFTTNPVLADKRVYSGILEDILVRVFVPILPPPVPPPPPLSVADDPPICREGFVLEPAPTPQTVADAQRPAEPASASSSMHRSQHQRRSETPHIAIVQARAPERGIFRSIVHPRDSVAPGRR